MIRRARQAVTIALLAGLFLAWSYSDQLFPPEQITAAAADVRDGDTFRLNGAIIRLAGIDAPEYHQLCADAAGSPWPCGKVARERLASLVGAAAVDCTVAATDRYQRRVARCATVAAGDLGAAMVRAGLAISPAERGTAVYVEEEIAARQAKHGIWQGAFDRPADWRAAHPRPIVAGSTAGQ